MSERNERRIWARGLTHSSLNKRIEIDGKQYILRSFEHLEKTTVLTLLTSLDVAHDAEVIIYD